MTLMIELPPELERRLEEEAARRGQAPSEFVCEAVAQRLSAPPGELLREKQRQLNQPALDLLRLWRKEDAEDPDLDPVPTIPSLALREITVE